MRIGAFDTDERVMVVAEIGNNHEGSFDTARELVRRAGESGADAVKFQTFRTGQFVARSDEARFARLESFELTIDQFAALAELARSSGLPFISTPLDLESVAGLQPLVDAYKIASGDVTFVPLLEAVAAARLPVLLSSGASTLDEVCAAIDVLRPGDRSDVAVLHCVSSYPVPAAEANLSAIRTIASACGGITPGYSDHVVGAEAAVAAVALGARIVEKHFTLDHHFSAFRDHQLSATPAELSNLVIRIRALEAMLGSGVKQLQPCERPLRDAIRRSAVFARDRRRGECFTTADVVWLRPAGGLAPGHEGALVGRRLARDVRQGDRIQPSDFE
jgi:N,N'-diacetyllegionaminate synthase